MTFTLLKHEGHWIFFVTEKIILKGKITKILVNTKMSFKISIFVNPLFECLLRLEIAFS